MATKQGTGALVRRRVERLIALADAVRASSGLAAGRAAAAAGIRPRHAWRWMVRLEALGIVRRFGERGRWRWRVTPLGRDRRRTVLRIGEAGAATAVPHCGRSAASRRAPRPDREALSRLVADRALHGHPAMLLVSNGAGDPLADEWDEW